MPVQMECAAVRGRVATVMNQVGIFLFYFQDQTSGEIILALVDYQLEERKKQVIFYSSCYP